MVTAIILINVTQGSVPDVAEALIRIPGIAEAYSVAGTYDLVAIARVGRHDELADLVAAQMQRIPGITGTNTLIAFRAYSQRDLAAMWEIGFEEPAD
jgi:DNA-binding Lrp family transcriptional regulator